MPDAAATDTAAAAVAKLAQTGDVFCLIGELGAGKTSFARGFLRALGIEEDIPSPTFNLLLTYETALGTVWHFDLYRLGSPDEVIELGMEDAFADGICLIEWPDRLGPWLPGERIEIHLSDDDGGSGRWLNLRAVGPGAERWRNPW
ncbi:MAG: tRNA (adenosine(37)-N6)-threonylcarbamoyltransferase complex ATPase subunit type 1 TsaE [Alphaproteobacteria bacterium]|jgi:tRNA threonylcarbamoyladenosine biosynthesis protein TsaE|nr:tRNA (adenosine(37)-N6)-threonylcarbamoyltransferase complex ATPase subunit type 1 TsaE [Alphaproteobacteria bacterium]MDP6829664.1 tRNA (adenosine(37)-N6)-threonylcarbamoyltransferase complex ATPase subunit type 1 TsaE [Alphaproteobacteria bacterium]MDP6876319.1 tRNA (adenosine(37)-N6)-threonylcarbamoyltransferase complex ATPase subunit type 1 TsaE [Alphaproteobacteria bacterium]